MSASRKEWLFDKGKFDEYSREISEGWGGIGFGEFIQSEIERNLRHFAGTVKAELRHHALDGWVDRDSQIKRIDAALKDRGIEP